METEIYEETIFIEDAIQLVRNSLEKQGASFSTKRKYQSILRCLAVFTNDNFHGEYTSEIGESFLKVHEQRVPKYLGQATFDIYVCAIQRINYVVEGDLEWYPIKPSMDYAKSKFDKTVKEYAEYLKNSGKTKIDVRSRVHTVARFLKYVDLQGVNSLIELRADHIYLAFQEATDKNGFRKAICAFLQYAHRYKLITNDFSIIVPSVKRHTPVPSVYSLEEIERLLSSIDRTSSLGKRNYAIILIAARLGLRSCDIADLSLADIDFDNDSIEIIQNKTGEPQTLPLLPEIKAALRDYIDMGRPKTESDKIFLKAILPLGRPMNTHSIYTIVSRQFDIADIPSKGRRRGPHTLRASLATSLLNEGIEYPVIQKVLGHTSKNAAKSYVKIDISHLRPFSLDVPAPTGEFKNQLIGTGAVL